MLAADQGPMQHPAYANAVGPGARNLAPRHETLLTNASAEMEQMLMKVPIIVCGLENLYSATAKAAGPAAGDCCGCAGLPFCT